MRMGEYNYPDGESAITVSEQGTELPPIITQEIGDPELGIDHIATEMKLL